MSFINKLSNELKIKNLTPEFFINAIQSLHNPRTMMSDITQNRRKPAMRISKESASFISDICEESSTRTLTAEQCQALFNELTGRAQLPNPRQELLSSLRDNTNSKQSPTSEYRTDKSIITTTEQEQK